MFQSLSNCLNDADVKEINSSSSILILVDEEMHGKERVHPKMETAQRKDKNGEDRENEVGVTQTGFDS